MKKANIIRTNATIARALCVICLLISPANSLFAANDKAVNRVLSFRDSAASVEKEDPRKMQKELEAVQSELNTTRETLKSTQEKQTKEAASSSAKISDLEKQIKEKEKDLSGRATKIDEQAKDLAKLQQQIAEAEARLNAIEKEKTSASVHITGLENALAAEKSNAAKKAKSDADALKAVQHDTQSKIAGLQKSLSHEQQKSHDISQQLATSQAELNAARAALKSTIEKQQNDAAASKSRIVELEKQLQKREGELSERTTALETRSRDLTKKQTLLAEVEARLNAIEKEKTSASAQIRALEQSLADQQAKAYHLESLYRDESLIRQGRALREQLDRADNPALTSSLNDVGLIYAAEGKLDAAEDAFRRALVIIDSTTGRANTSGATILQHLGDLAWRNNNLAGAASFYDEAANVFAAALGEAHPRYAAVLNSQASVKRAQQQPAEAEKIYRAALDIYASQSSSRAEDVAVTSCNLGVLLMEQGRLAEAGPLLERAAHLAEQNPGTAPVRTLAIMRSMTRYAQATGNVEMAARYESKVNELALNYFVP